LPPEALGAGWAGSGPGIGRELEPTVVRAAILSRGRPIGRERLEQPERPTRSDPFDSLPLDEGFHALVRRLERRLIERALEDANGNRTEAAARLGISRRLLYDKLQQLGLS
jgi:two-component system NtrC family response regulator